MFPQIPLQTDRGSLAIRAAHFENQRPGLYFPIQQAT